MNMFYSAGTKNALSKSRKAGKRRAKSVKKFKSNISRPGAALKYLSHK